MFMVGMGYRDVATVRYRALLDGFLGKPPRPNREGHTHLPVASGFFCPS